MPCATTIDACGSGDFHPQESDGDLPHGLWTGRGPGLLELSRHSFGNLWGRCDQNVINVRHHQAVLDVHLSIFIFAPKLLQSPKIRL